MPNLKILALAVPEIKRGSQNSKTRSRDPFTTCKYAVAGNRRLSSMMNDGMGDKPLAPSLATLLP